MRLRTLLVAVVLAMMVAPAASAQSLPVTETSTSVHAPPVVQVHAGEAVTVQTVVTYTRPSYVPTTQPTETDVAVVDATDGVQAAVSPATLHFPYHPAVAQSSAMMQEASVDVAVLVPEDANGTHRVTLAAHSHPNGALAPSAGEATLLVHVVDGTVEVESVQTAPAPNTQGAASSSIASAGAALGVAAVAAVGAAVVVLRRWNRA